MFTADERTLLRRELLDRAAQDPRISGAALTGSAAAASEDAWSDIDLAFGVRAGTHFPTVLSDWTAHMYDQRQAVHHLDVVAGAWTYRVFLLSNALQVDLAFVTETEFRAVGPAFRLQFGSANDPRHAAPPPAEALIGLAWLHALHARGCLARRRLWQAEYMISGVRNNTFALACRRHGLATDHGRGFDRLPEDVAARFENSLVARLDEECLRHAFRVVVDLLLAEIQEADAPLAARLHRTLASLAD